MTKLLVATAVAGVLATLTAGTACAQQVRVLAVGVNSYDDPTIEPLSGAVGDAEAVASAARRLYGATDVVTLTERGASRAAITGAMEQLIGRATRGDHVILSFSLHGGQEPERVSGDEADGLDEVLLLAGFREAGAAQAERIVDNEIYAWIQRLTAKGVKVVILVDSCHSGTAVRSSFSETYKNHAYEIDILSDPLGSMPVVAANESLPAGVFFIGAGLDNQRVPELSGVPTLDGRTRVGGAATAAFVEAMQQAVTRGGLSRADMQSGMAERIHALAGGKQTPSFLPATPDVNTIVLPARSGAAPLPAVPATPSASRVLRLEVRNASPADRRAAAAIPSVELVESGQRDAIWDAGCQGFWVPAGDWTGGAETRTLAAFTSTEAVMSSLRTHRAMGGLELRGDSQRVGSGQPFQLSLAGARLQHTLVFSVSANGAVFLQYPTADDVPLVNGRAQWRFNAAPPYGADYFVAVNSARSLEGLRARLAHLDATQSATAATTSGSTVSAISGGIAEVGQILLSVLAADPSARISVHGIFTGDPTSCETSAQ